MVSKVTFKYALDTSKLKPEDRKKVKEQVGEFVVDRILEEVAKLNSPVKGHNNFKRLSTVYAKEKSKTTIPVPNLELKGKMLKKLSSKTYKGGVEIGIFDKTEAQKADNHNKFSGKSKATGVPARKFIPNKADGEHFKKKITKAVDKILDKYEEKALKGELARGLNKGIDNGNQD